MKGTAFAVPFFVSFTMKYILLIAIFCFSVQVYSQHKSLELGEKVPNITIKNHLGGYNNLYENLGQTTIVHFWGSWSKACIPMNKYLGDIYQKHKLEGLVIFSVSIDKKTRHWLEEIENQGLGWPLHGSDFKGMVHSKPAKDYEIFEVPSTFVLDEELLISYFYGATINLMERDLLENMFKKLENDHYVNNV